MMRGGVWRLKFLRSHTLPYSEKVLWLVDGLGPKESWDTMQCRRCVTFVNGLEILDASRAWCNEWDILLREMLGHLFNFMRII